MSNPSYSGLLKDPRWQKKRLEVLERDCWACQWCGDKKNTLHVHHKRYVKGKKPWEYESSDLLTVCADCHDSEYRYRHEFEQSLLDSLRLAGASPWSLANLVDSFPVNLSPGATGDLMMLLGFDASSPNTRKALFAHFGLTGTGGPAVTPSQIQELL